MVHVDCSAIIKFPLRLQEARLQVLEKLLQQREDEHAEMTSKRLNKLW